MIKGILRVLCSTLLLISMIVLGISWDLSSSLNYNNVQSQAVNLFPIVDQTVNITQILDNKLSVIKDYCVSNSDFVFNYGGYVFETPCSSINRGESAIINDTINNFIKGLYYKNYSCDYWKCFSNYSTSPFFLVSQTSEDYWSNLFRMSIVVSIILAGILFLLIEKKKNFPIVIGITTIVSSLPLLGIGKIISGVSNKLVSEIVSLFFSQSNTIFITMMIAGIVMVFIGLIIELFDVEFKIYDLFSRGNKNDNNRRK